MFAVFVLFQVMRRAGNFALAVPTREVLYTVLPRRDKYKAKNFNDLFVYRAGDQIGVWSFAGLGALGLGKLGAGADHGAAGGAVVGGRAVAGEEAVSAGGKWAGPVSRRRRIAAPGDPAARGQTSQSSTASRSDLSGSPAPGDELVRHVALEARVRDGAHDRGVVQLL